MTSDTAPRWANRRQAREYLSTSEATLWRYVRDGVIKQYAIGRSPRFDLNELDEAVRSGFTPKTTVTEVIDTIRRQLTDDNPRTLISYARVHEVINDVAAQYGANPAVTAGATDGR